MSLCTSIEKVKHIDSANVDVLRVTIDNNVTALWLYDYSKAVEFINKEVIVDYRKDVLDGEMHDFIATIVRPTQVNVLEAKEQIKLFCDQEDNFSNLSFSEIGMNEVRPGCIVYCISQEFKSSTKSVWMELRIRDRSMHVGILRIFNYENIESQLAGGYIVTALSRSKYGFETDMAAPATGECPKNPEIDIAKQYIKTFFQTDVFATEYIARTNILDKLSEEIDYEVGYGLVRLAVELSLVDAMQNITKDYDLDSIAHALLASRGYFISAGELSQEVRSVMIAMQLKWKNKMLVLRLLDPGVEGIIERPKEYMIYESIKTMANATISARKGVE